jgi:hypothetical protein
LVGETIPRAARRGDASATPTYVRIARKTTIEQMLKPMVANILTSMSILQILTTRVDDWGSRELQYVDFSDLNNQV